MNIEKAADMAPAPAETGTIRHFLFGSRGELFAIPVRNPIEVLRVKKISALRRLPDYVAGVIKWRGLVVPVVDAGVRAGRHTPGFSRNNPIVIVGKVGFQHYGLLADAVYPMIEKWRLGLQTRASLLGRFTDEQIVSGVVCVEVEGKMEYVTLLNFQNLVSGFDVQGLLARLHKQ